MNPGRYAGLLAPDDYACLFDNILATRNERLDHPRDV